MSDLDLSQHQILLVDDVVFARATVKKILTSFGRPRVIEAAHGEEALDILNDVGTKLSMIVSDFNMPKKNGLELLQAIRCGQTNYPRDFPVAMLTGYSDEHLVDMALGLDVNAFLIKPISRDTMGVRLHKMIEMMSDTDWLKPAADYDVMEIATATEPEKKSKPTRVVSGEPTKPIFVTARRPASKLSGKFSDAELADMPSAPPSKGTFGDTDLATRRVMGTLSSLVGRLEDPVSAKEVAVGFQRLIADGDRDAAQNLVTVLDTFEKRGVISGDDIAAVFNKNSAARYKTPRTAGSAPTQIQPDPEAQEIFSPLESIEEGSVLSRPLHTPDGSVLLSDGTTLTSQVLDVLKKLDDLDLLLLEALTDDADAGRGVFVRSPDAVAPSTGSMVALPLSRVPANAILARDIHLVDGRLYMTAGTVLSPRLLSLLQDLVELDRFEGQVHIVD